MLSKVLTFLALAGSYAAPVPAEQQPATPARRTQSRRTQSTSELVDLLKPVVEDPRTNQAIHDFATDPRIYEMTVLMMGPEVGEALQSIAEVDLNEAVGQMEQILMVMGDMDMSEVKESLKAMQDGGDPSAMMDKLQGADLSSLAGDLSSSGDLADLAASLDNLDLSALDDVTEQDLDPQAGMEGAMASLQSFKEAYDQKMADDPALAAYMDDLSHNLQQMLLSHKNDYDDGEALQADMEAFVHTAAEEYQQVEDFTDAEKLVMEDGLTALTEYLTTFYSIAEDNIDVAALTKWVATYQAQQVADNAKKQIQEDRNAARNWFWGEDEKSPAERAVDELIPTPPHMTPYQTKQFERVKAEAVTKYQAHPDFKTMSDQEIARWNAKLLQEAQADMSTFLSNQQLKQWASVAYHTNGR